MGVKAKSLAILVAVLALAAFAGCNRQARTADRCEGNCEDGEGTMYKPEGSKYSGHWKDGKADGQGTAYSSDGEKIYEGNWKANNYDGQGTEYLPGGGKYVGDFKNDKKDGHGALFMPDGSKVYDGMWKNGAQVPQAAPPIANPSEKPAPKAHPEGTDQKVFPT